MTASEPDLSPLERKVALVVLSLLLLHAAAGFLIPIPGWKMFVVAHEYEYELRDREGRAIDLRDYVSRETYLVNHGLPLEIGRWLAREQPERAPLTGWVRIITSEEEETYRFEIEPGGSYRTWSATEPDPTGESSSSSKG